MHRRFALPTFVDSFMLLLLMIDQAVADERSVDGRARWGSVSDFFA